MLYGLSGGTLDGSAVCRLFLAQSADREGQIMASMHAKIAALGITLPDPLTADSLRAAVEAVHPGKQLVVQEAQHVNGETAVSVELVNKPILARAGGQQ